MHRHGPPVADYLAKTVVVDKARSVPEKRRRPDKARRQLHGACHCRQDVTSAELDVDARSSSSQSPLQPRTTRSIERSTGWPSCYDWSAMSSPYVVMRHSRTTATQEKPCLQRLLYLGSHRHTELRGGAGRSVLDAAPQHLLCQVCLRHDGELSRALARFAAPFSRSDRAQIDDDT